MELTDEEILLKLSTFEDSFVERKTSSDSKDWLKTVVAFANSAPVGYPAILFIGVKDDGSVEDSVNLDSLQKTLSAKLTNVHPAVYHVTKILQKDGRQFLAVIVPGSENRPHFAGPAYVRRGSQSVRASEEQFNALIASRTAKARLILEWKSKPVTVHRMNVEHVMHTMGRVASTREMIVRDCNSFYVTLSESALEGSSSWSFPLRVVDISFDNVKGQLALEIRPT